MDHLVDSFPRWRQDISWQKYLTLVRPQNNCNTDYGISNILIFDERYI